MSATLKTQLLDGVRAHITAQLDALATMISASRDEATSDESRPENKYDTRALEASYLAAGQGERLAALKQLVGWLEQVPAELATHAKLGGFVRVDEGWLFLAPQGGHEVRVDPHLVRLVSTRSPLGRAVVGCEAGDDCEYDTPAGPREIEVLEVL